MRVRYYVKGLPLHLALVRILIDGFAKLGLRIEPFHLTEENLSKGRSPMRKGAGDAYQVGFLQPSDMPSLAAIPGRAPTEADLQKRLRDGHLCLGIRQEGEIVGFTWADLEAVRFEDYPLFRLQANEAYLFDAYTVEAARGSGLAPHMRYRLYEELAKLGRNRCYSITVLFNKPASRFKAKLGAQVLELNVLIEVFRRWRIHRTLRRYQQPSA
jgi:GNAT superfamily N-acetyltransferase